MGKGRNMNPYKLENGYEITRRGHKLFPEDIIKDLNYWRNKSRKFQTERIGSETEFLKELRDDLQMLDLSENEPDRDLIKQIDQAITDRIKQLFVLVGSHE